MTTMKGGAAQSPLHQVDRQDLEHALLAGMFIHILVPTARTERQKFIEFYAFSTSLVDGGP
jgi:hypothetical protein